MIVLLIPLITIFLNYNINIQTIKSEIGHMNEITMDNLSDEIDRIMTEQVNVYNYLFTDVFFRSWISHNEKNTEYYTDAYRVMTQISGYVKYSSDISCLLYMVDENYIIQNTTANNARHLYNAFRDKYKEFPEYEEWIELLSGYYDNEFVFLNYVNGNTNEKCLVYADSLALSGNKLVNIFISVPLKEIAALTASLDSKALLIMSSGDTVEVISGNESVLSSELKELVLSGEAAFETEEYMGTVKKSIYKDFSYCLLNEKKEFWAKSTHIRNIFCISVVITLFVGFGVVSFLLRRNFMPVSSLLQKVSGKKEHGNEFYQIELAYSCLKNENKSMKQILQGQKEALLGSYLLSVMKEHKKGLSDDEKDFFGLEEGKSMILSGFYVPSSDELLRFSIDNVFSELMVGEHFCHIENGDYMLYLFFAEQGKEAEFAAECDRRVSYLLELFQQKWEVALSFKKTAPETGLDSIASLYRQLMYDFTSTSEGEEETEQSNEEIRGIVAYVLGYVEEHYADCGLNISSIADSIDKNPKYISRVFKETMGEGILDYVNRIRIAKAKEIIAIRRYSTEEAGKMVGYASNQTFRRAFIKIVGITPGKYMDSLQNK